jgi:hypothetical protein
MSAEPLGKFTEFGGVHPHGKRTTGRDRRTTRAGTQTVEQRTLRIIHCGFIDHSETWREALGRHLATFCVRWVGAEATGEPVEMALSAANIAEIARRAAVAG